MLGEVYWKGGYSLGGFIKLVNGNGMSLVEYKAIRLGSKMGVMEIHMELGQEGLDEIVVGGLATLSEETTSMSASAAGMSTS